MDNFFGALLLQDAYGEKVDSSFLGRLKTTVVRHGHGRSRPVSISVVNIARGELIVPIPGDQITPRDDGKRPHNYRLSRKWTVTLYCTGSELSPLTDYEFGVLDAIRSPQMRYIVFTSDPNKLNWGSHLKEGDLVCVFLLPADRSVAASTRCVSAAVRYIGPVATLPGIMFGVEIMDEKYRGSGTTDGMLQGQRYFHCEENCGVFVALDRLSARPKEVSPHTQLTDPQPAGQGEQKKVGINPCENEEEQGEGKLLQEQRKLQDENACLKKDNDALELAKQQNQHECLRLQRQVSHQRKESEELVLQLQQLQEECFRLQQQAQIDAQVKLELQDQKQQLQREQWRLQQQNQANVQAKLNLQHEKQQLQELCSELGREKDSLQQQLQRQIEENQQLQTKIDDAEILELYGPMSLQSISGDVEFPSVPREEVQVLSQIGHGAWGCVGKGRFQKQDVAVKWPHNEILNKDTSDRLQREVKIMAQVRHPNLVRLIAAVFDDRTPPLIITELLDMNLRTAYETGRLSGSSRIPVFCDVAYALHYLHEHQQPIIHRDVSAPNVLLEVLPCDLWRAKLSDFGSANLAKLARTQGEGAIIYAAPETIPQTQEPGYPLPPQTTKIDVYSYGVLLCEVITCQLPLAAKYWSMLQQVRAQWSFMYDIITNCTKRDPDDRPTMAQVLDELNKLPRPRPRQRSPYPPPRK